MRDGELATMMQQKEEEETQKSIYKEQWAMASTPTGKALLLVQRVLPLHHFLQSSIPQNVGVALKVQSWRWTVFFPSWIVYYIYKRYLESLKKNPLWT